jgi:hypothetical protein
MTSGRTLGIAVIAALGLATMAAPHAASPAGSDEEPVRQVVKMDWWVKKVRVASGEDCWQDILKGKGKPFGRVTINMCTPPEDVGSEEKRVNFYLFPWRGHHGRGVAGEIPVKNTILDATSSWQKERVELDGTGVFSQGECERPLCERPEQNTKRYAGEITKFSGVLKCVYATATCEGNIAVRGWFESYVKD